VDISAIRGQLFINRGNNAAGCRRMSMRLFTIAIIALLPVPLFAQVPQPLPPAANDAPVINGLEMTAFDPEQLSIKRVDGRWQLLGSGKLLKDFGIHESEAKEALRLVRDLHFTKHATIQGATPIFEFWLGDEGPSKGGLAVRNVIPFNARMLTLENIGGAWVIRDDKMMLYNFGTQRDSAELAMAVMKKHGFNQLGLIGLPLPVMTYLTVDPYARAPQQNTPPPTREIAQAVAMQGLLIPNSGYVGAKQPFDARKLEVVRQPNDWVLELNKNVVGRFGPDLSRAREAMRVLQDARITEVAMIGKGNFPIYLSSGNAPKFVGLGFNNVRINSARMAVQQINSIWCIVDDGKIYFEFGTQQADAELVLKVLQHFQFDQICPVGDLRVFVRSR